jgi:NADH-quinone oxidoreductase subunit F
VFSGISNPVILPVLLGTSMDFGSFKRINSGLGSGGYIVYDDRACMVQVAYKFSEFLSTESCSQCIACKYGTSQATNYLHRLVQGSGNELDLEYVFAGAAMAPQGNRCYLPVEHSLLIPSIVRSFPDEFIQHYNRGCQSCRKVVLPKMVDFDESRGRFRYAS